MPLPTSIPSQKSKRNTARDPRFTFSNLQPFLICTAPVCTVAWSFCLEISVTALLSKVPFIHLHTVPRWNAGLVDCLQLPIPVHRLRNKLDSLHAAVSVVVRNLWRSLGYSAEYSNQNLSNVTSAPGWLQGLTAANASYASLCTFQPRLPPEFSCLWHPTNCGQLTMDTTSSDKHSA